MNIKNVDDQTAVFTLETGEEIRIQFEDALGVEGYRLKVIAPKKLLINPQSGNSLILMTPKSESELEAKVQEVVRQRNMKKDNR